MASAAKRRLVPTYQESKKGDYDDEDNYYCNKKQMQRNKNMIMKMKIILNPKNFSTWKS